MKIPKTIWNFGIKSNRKMSIPNIKIPNIKIPNKIYSFHLRVIDQRTQNIKCSC